eukprot:c3209_g1_i1.p2 GENE.c3209_g1_i1~~c3209_g1_i1.p2  ORF type:complete len:482 (+),score=129.36 c3209_g1_i1:98-1543(+)
MMMLRPFEPVVPEPNAPRVVDVRAFVIGSKALEEESGGGADCHSQSKGHWIVDTPICNPMSVYSEYKRSRLSWGINALGTVVVEVELSNGMVGVGISIGGEPACFCIENHLSRFVIDQDPRNVELIWDQMWRATVNYGRKGLPIHAISAVDLALWDVLGKLRNEPVYMLLGGRTKGRLPVYATTDRPDLAKKMGFVGAKIPLPFGPADGPAGMTANIERLKEVRKSVGEEFPLMIDCYMSLTVPYAVELARRIEKDVPGGVFWLEEMLQPDDYEGHAQLRARINTTMLTCGEHEYTRWGYKLLLEKGCVDVLQPDITWVGGITEARRVCALASAYNVSVIPHGSSVFSYHLQYAFSNCPMAEYLILSPGGDKIVPLFGDTFTDEPLPSGGYVDLDPAKPGFGVTLNRSKLNLKRPFPRPTIPNEPSHRQTVIKSVPNQSEWLKSTTSNLLLPLDATSPATPAPSSSAQDNKDNHNDTPKKV